MHPLDTAIPSSWSNPNQPIDPKDLLALAADHFGDGAVLVSSLGPQTLVILDILHRTGRMVPVLMLDTRVLFPETLTLRTQVEQRYNIDIRVLRSEPTPEQRELWKRDTNRCCHLRKVVPLSKALEGYKAWITGLRRGQSKTRSATRQWEWDPNYGLVKVNPLAFWTRDQVFAYLREHDVPHNPLLHRGYLSVGCRPCTTPSVDALDERSGRWEGSEKTECGIHLS